MNSCPHMAPPVPMQVRITELPPWLNRVVDFMLIPLGHAIGIKPIYPQYVSLTRAEGLAREQAYKAHQAAAQVEPAAAAAAVDGSGDVTDAAEPVSEVPTEPASDRSEL